MFVHAFVRTTQTRLLALLVLQVGCGDESAFDPEAPWGLYLTTAHERFEDACEGSSRAVSAGSCALLEGSGESAEPGAVSFFGIRPCDGEPLDIRVEGLLPQGSRWLGREFSARVCTESCLGGTTANCTNMCPRGSGSCTLTARISTIEWIEPEVISLDVRDLRHDVAVPPDMCTEELAQELESEMECVSRESIAAERIPIPE